MCCADGRACAFVLVATQVGDTPLMAVLRQRGPNGCRQAPPSSHAIRVLVKGGASTSERDYVSEALLSHLPRHGASAH